MGLLPFATNDGQSCFSKWFSSVINSNKIKRNPIECLQKKSCVKFYFDRKFYKILCSILDMEQNINILKKKKKKNIKHL